MEILQLIKDFFIILFSGNSPEGKRKKELRKIQQLLKTIVPPIYRSGVILPGFPTAVLTFWQLIKPLYEFYKQSLGSDDIRVVQKCRDAFLERALTPTQIQQKKFFSYDYRKKDMEEAVNLKMLKEDSEKKFLNFLKNFDTSQMQDADIKLSKLEAFGDVLMFNYENMLNPFDVAFTISSENYVPKFLSVSIKQMIPNLSDFYYVFHGISFDMNLATSMMTLVEIISGEKLQEEDCAKIAKIIKNLATFSLELFSPDLICSLLRLAKEDPQYIPPFQKEKNRYLSDYKQRLQTCYQKDTERLSREQPEDDLMQTIRTVFGDVPLLTLRGYTEDLSLQIQQVTPNSFLWVKPLRVIKTFCKCFFTEEMRTVFNSILIEGFFSNKQFEADLSASFHACVSSEDNFDKFEASFDSGKPNDSLVLASYVTEIQSGNDFEQKIQTMVDNINYQAKQLVQEETTVIEEFVLKMDEVISESRKTVPENIINIRTLLSSKPFDYIGVLEKKRVLATGVLSIMKNYALVKTV